MFDEDDDNDSEPDDESLPGSHSRKNSINTSIDPSTGKKKTVKTLTPEEKSAKWEINQ